MFQMMMAAVTMAASTSDVFGGLTGIWQLTFPTAFLGLLIFNGISVMRGWFIPRVSHERELALANKRGDDWEKAAAAKDLIIAKQSEQLSQMLEVGRTVDAVLKATTPPSIFGQTAPVGGE